MRSVQCCIFFKDVIYIYSAKYVCIENGSICLCLCHLTENNVYRKRYSQNACSYLQNYTRIHCQNEIGSNIYASLLVFNLTVCYFFAFFKLVRKWQKNTDAEFKVNQIKNKGTFSLFSNNQNFGCVIRSAKNLEENDFLIEVSDFPLHGWKITVQSFESTILLTTLFMWKPDSEFCTRGTPMFNSVKGKKEMSTRQSGYYKLKGCFPQQSGLRSVHSFLTYRPFEVNLIIYYRLQIWCAKLSTGLR